MATERVEVYRLSADEGINSRCAHKIVRALRLANRVVEVTWDGTNIIFLAAIPRAKTSEPKP